MGWPTEKVLKTIGEEIENHVLHSQEKEFSYGDDTFWDRHKHIKIIIPAEATLKQI